MSRARRRRPVPSERVSEIRRACPYADPEAAARRLLEHAHAFEPIHDGRIYIEKLNGPFLFQDRGTPAEYQAGLNYAIEKGWLKLHESGTFVHLSQTGKDLFARLSRAAPTDDPV